VSPSIIIIKTQVPMLADWIYSNIIYRGFQIFLRVSASVAIFSYNLITQVGTTIIRWTHQAAKWYFNFSLSLAHKTWQLGRDLLHNHIIPGIRHYVPIIWGYTTAPAAWLWAQTKMVVAAIHEWVMKTIIQPLLDWLNTNIINPTYKSVSDTYRLHR